MSGGWIGVDLDGTLAEWHGSRGPDHIGKPIRRMRLRVVRWLAEGKDVRIFTARTEASYPAIEKWCLRHLGKKLPITNVKDYGCEQFWDDRAVQVVPNTGRRVDGED